MKSTYKVENHDIVSVTTVFKLTEITKALNDEEYTSYEIKRRIQDKVAQECAAVIIREKLHEILGLMKPQEIANLATIQAMNDITRR